MTRVFKFDVGPREDLIEWATGEFLRRSRKPQVWAGARWTFLTVLGQRAGGNFPDTD